jgi:hypothetical protein
VSLHLTAAGERLNRLHSGTVEAAVRRALRQVSRKDLIGARVVLRTLIDDLEGSSPPHTDATRLRAAPPLGSEPSLPRGDREPH